MNSRQIHSIAKSIQPFLKEHKNKSPEVVYKTIMSKNHLDFIKQMFSIEDIIILIFMAYEISIGNDDPSIINNIENNLFFFNTYDFGDVENEMTCPECNGEGRELCHQCGGEGQMSCGECENGETDCEDCQGDGINDEYEDCSTCQGGGKVTCPNCDGSENVECDYCDGTGFEECDECSGTGEIICYDRIPFTISTYASYDLNLEEIIQQKISRREPVNFNKDISSAENKIITLYLTDYNVNELEDNNISEIFANNEYFGEVLSKGEAHLVFTNNKIEVPLLDEKRPEMFQSN